MVNSKYSSDIKLTIKSPFHSAPKIQTNTRINPNLGVALSITSKLIHNRENNTAWKKEKQYKSTTEQWNKTQEKKRTPQTRSEFERRPLSCSHLS